uniref:Tetratricopeptide repeat domain 23 n=1 Tax=Gasterosteus aculeatus aculeatus TaxID=481459 RepID=A0AAQ4PP37_GASAC
MEKSSSVKHIPEWDACIQDLVRCVALCRLLSADDRLKLAQAHARLATAYFQLKGWGLQAKEHSALARELLLPLCSPTSSCRDDELQVLVCLLSVHLTHGGASLQTDNLEEAECSFLEAERVLGELHQLGGINQEEKMKTELEISTCLSRVYRRLSRPEEALSRCEKSLQWLKDCGKPEKTCCVYRDMAAIEQDEGHLDQAIEHLTKAHAIAMSHCPEELEGAQISHSLALILSSAAEPHHNDSAGCYFEESLSAYANSAGPEDPAFLAAQDDFCRFLLRSGQQEVTHTHTHTHKQTLPENATSVISSKERYINHILANVFTLFIPCCSMETPSEFVTVTGDLFHLLIGMYCSSPPRRERGDSSIFNVPFQRCVEIQKASLAKKRTTFGDLSAEVADTLLLIGSVEMSEGRLKPAHRTMSKCLEIQSLLYGPQHKKTKATQKAVDILARIPEVVERQRRQSRRETKRHTLTVQSCSGNDDNSTSDS